MQHTPAPWIMDPHKGNLDKKIGINNRAVLVDNDDVPTGEGVVNAARIIACVNACEGIPIEQLEGMALGALYMNLKMSEPHYRS